MTDATPVSWQAAWRGGLAVAFRHWTLIGLAFIAVLCERAVLLAADLAQMNTGNTVAVARRLLSEIQKGPGAIVAPRIPEPSEAALLAAVVILFLFGLLVLIGVLGLIRDLLTGRQYHLRDFVARGGRYFWPVVKLKVPIYLALGALLAAVLSMAPAGQGRSVGFWTWAAAGGAICTFAFIGARVVLSLGDKIIVTEDLRSPMAVYRRVLLLLRPHLSATLCFYGVMVLVTAITGVASVLSAALPLGIGVRFILIAFELALATVCISASGFQFYLQLASVVCPGRSESAIGPPQPGIESRRDIWTK